MGQLLKCLRKNSFIHCSVPSKFNIEFLLPISLIFKFLASIISLLTQNTEATPGLSKLAAVDCRRPEIYLRPVIRLNYSNTGRGGAFWWLAQNYFWWSVIWTIIFWWFGDEAFLVIGDWHKIIFGDWWYESFIFGDCKY